jgi:predicted transcriptional regulator
VATVTFKVPDEIKEAFERTFANENRSAIIARLMKEAVEDRKRHDQWAAAIDSVFDVRRDSRTPSS